MWYWKELDPCIALLKKESKRSMPIARLKSLIYSFPRDCLKKPLWLVSWQLKERTGEIKIKSGTQLCNCPDLKLSSHTCTVQVYGLVSMFVFPYLQERALIREIPSRIWIREVWIQESLKEHRVDQI